MENYSYEERKAILELVNMADTGDTMDVYEFLEEFEKEERRREKYKKNAILKLGDWLEKTTKKFVRI